MRALREPFRYGLDSLRLEAVMVLVVTCYLIVQLLPLGSFLVLSAGDVALTSRQISIAPGATVLTVLRFATYALFFFLVLQVSMQPHRRALLLNIMLAITVCYAIYGLLALYQFGDTLLGVGKWAYPGSATGPFVNRNSFATFLAFGAATALLASRLTATGMAQKRSHPDSISLLYGLALAILLTTVIASSSRTGIIVLAAACMTVLFCLFGKRRSTGFLVLLVAPLS